MTLVSVVFGTFMVLKRFTCLLLATLQKQLYVTAHIVNSFSQKWQSLFSKVSFRLAFKC